MTISNVGTLQTAVEARMERTLSDALFLEFLQSMFGVLHYGLQGADGRTWVSPPLRCRAMLTTGELTTSGGSVALSGLTRWLEFERLWIDDSNDGRALEYLSLPAFRSYSGASLSGTPQAYTIDDERLYVAPTGDATIDVTYYQSFAIPTGDSDTNWLFTDAPHVLVSGALMEAYDWEGNDEQAAKHQARFAAAVRALNDVKLQSQGAGSARIMRPGAVA